MSNSWGPPKTSIFNPIKIGVVFLENTLRNEIYLGDGSISGLGIKFETPFITIESPKKNEYYWGVSILGLGASTFIFKEKGIVFNNLGTNFISEKNFKSYAYLNFLNLSIGLKNVHFNWSFFSPTQLFYYETKYGNTFGQDDKLPNKNTIPSAFSITYMWR